MASYNPRGSANTDDLNGEIKQWVSVVTNYSSQYDDSSWCARQVVGSPRVYPEYGDIAGAWAMGDIDAQQFLELEYAEPVFITGLDIYETYHAGGVKAIYGRDPSDKWRPLWKTDRVQAITTSRVFSPPIKDPGFLMKQIRIEVDCTVCGTWVEIDAVQLRGKKHMSAPPPSVANLAEDYRKMVNNETFSDVEFLVDGKTIYAHKVILSARCDYFRAMFQHSMKESKKVQHDEAVTAPGYLPTPLDNEPPPSYSAAMNMQVKRANLPNDSKQKCIELPGVSFHSFMGVMHYLYSNSIPDDFDGISLTELWRVADRYSIDGLKQYATFTISMKLDSTNVVDIYVDSVTQLPVIEEVKKTCLMYMSVNMDKVVVSKSFASLPQELMLEVIQATTAKLSLSD